MARLGSYGANYNVFGDGINTETTWNPNGVKGYTKIPASTPDGLSNTVFFTEMYATCQVESDVGDCRHQHVVPLQQLVAPDRLHECRIQGALGNHRLLPVPEVPGAARVE